MSFDIYGNNLARGHCEVHPNVAEEYPCSLCMAQSNRKEAFNPNQELNYHLGQCQERIEELEAGIKELEAKYQKSCKSWQDLVQVKEVRIKKLEKMIELGVGLKELGRDL